MTKLNHVEIPVLDLKKAKKFYKDIFDWSIDLEAMPNYGLLDDPDWVSLGFYPVEEIPSHGVNAVFEVDDIEETLQKVTEAGGEIVREKYLIAEGIGYAADFTDIFGNQLSLFSRA